MKRFTILLSLLVALILNPVNAQESGLKFGTKLSVGQSRVLTNFYTDNPAGEINFLVGGSSIFMFNQYLGARADILVQYTKMEATGQYTYPSGVFGQPTIGKFTDDISFFNLQVPLTFHGQLGKGKFHPYTDLGVAPGLQLFGIQNREYDDVDYNDENGFEAQNLRNSNVFSLSSVVGLGFSADTKAGKSYFIEFQWMMGLIPMGTFKEDTRSDEYSMDQLNLAFGYFF